MVRTLLKIRKVRACNSGSAFCDNTILLVKMVGHLLNATIVNSSFILGLSVLIYTDLYWSIDVPVTSLNSICECHVSYLDIALSH